MSQLAIAQQAHFKTNRNQRPAHDLFKRNEKPSNAHIKTKTLFHINHARLPVLLMANTQMIIRSLCNVMHSIVNAKDLISIDCWTAIPLDTNWMNEKWNSFSLQRIQATESSLAYETNNQIKQKPVTVHFKRWFHWERHWIALARAQHNNMYYLIIFDATVYSLLYPFSACFFFRDKHLARLLSTLDGIQFRR